LNRGRAAAATKNEARDSERGLHLVATTRPR
jgi:hypothetical protein